MTLEQLIHQHLDELSDLDKDYLTIYACESDKVRSSGSWSLPKWFMPPNLLC